MFIPHQAVYFVVFVILVLVFGKGIIWGDGPEP